MCVTHTGFVKSARAGLKLMERVTRLQHPQPADAKNPPRHRPPPATPPPARHNHQMKCPINRLRWTKRTSSSAAASSSPSSSSKPKREAKRTARSTRSGSAVQGQQRHGSCVQPSSV